MHAWQVLYHWATALAQEIVSLGVIRIWLMLIEDLKPGHWVEDCRFSCSEGKFILSGNY